MVSWETCWYVSRRSRISFAPVGLVVAVDGHGLVVVLPVRNQKERGIFFSRLRACMRGTAARTTVLTVVFGWTAGQV